MASWTGTALLAATLSLPLAGTSSAEPTGPDAERVARVPDAGRGAATARRGSGTRQAPVARQVAAEIESGDVIEMPSSYPFQPPLRFYRDNPDDASDTAALLGHPDLAPQLTEWMQESDRISTQVVGQSTQGRDLYLVTVTAPETEEETAQQTEWREEIMADPAAAATDAELLAQYKTPVWISNNIHGNEWEGTDATMQYIDWLVSRPLSEVGSILRNNRLYFSLSLNPDGRTNATRATALGFDPNRDMITNATPETKSYIRTAQAVQPIYTADFHGYTRVLQMEPTGPPHGSNYEYDLYLPHNYALALEVEQDVVAADIPGNTYYDRATGAVTPVNTGNIKIPYRDTPSGWDDFPPIFTAQYAAFYGAASATVELPLQRGAADGTRQTPANARINTEVAVRTVRSIVEYLNDPATAREMLRNQIETFRRGTVGEPKRRLTTEDVAGVPGPAEWKPLWDAVDDQEPVSLPRAYVIPVGDGQRSASDATRLVSQLLLHEIEVERLTEDASVGGSTFPAGSYVVDMHQPLRGLANSLLDLGEDISPKVPSMYDISGWSLAELWGATVASVGSTTERPVGDTEPVAAPAPNAAMPEDGYLAFDLAGVRDFAAVDSLLDAGIAVSSTGNGTAVVAPADRDAVAAASEEFDLEVTEASEDDLAALGDESTRGLSNLTIGYVGTQDDRVSLTELGFDGLVNLSGTALETNPALLDGVDVVWIGSGHAPVAGSQTERAMQAFVDGGGSLVGEESRQATYPGGQLTFVPDGAFTAAKRYGVLDAAVSNGNAEGNGIVAVEHPPGSLLAAHPQDRSFIYPAFWFTGLGDGVTVEQRYATDPFLAGHWTNTASNGPEQAAGQASAISAETDEGGRVFVFGTSLFFRNHPKGLLSEAARALYWAGPEGDRVPAPAPATTTTLTAPERVAYPRAVVLEAVVTADGAGTPTGSVEFLDQAGRVVATVPLDGAGEATAQVSGVRPGVRSFTARFVPGSDTFAGSTTEAVAVRVDRARSQVGIARTALGPGQATFAVTLRIDGLRSTGPVRITDRGRVIRTLRFTGRATQSVTVRLAPGRHIIRAVFPGSADAAPATSRAIEVRR